MGGVEDCFAFCSKTGLSFFGIERGKRCWCAAAYEGASVSGGSCDSPCQESGKPGGCGGITSASVYVSYDCSGYHDGLYLRNIVESNTQNKSFVRVLDVKGPVMQYISGGKPRFMGLPKLLMGAKYIQGSLMKTTGKQSFTINYPAKVFLAINETWAAPEGFGFVIYRRKKYTTPFFDGKGKIEMPLYVKKFNAGKVEFRFRKKTIAGVFVVEEKGVMVTNVLPSAADGLPIKLTDVMGSSVQYATKKTDGNFVNVAPNIVSSGGKYLLGGKMKSGKMGFDVDRGVTVYIAIDGTMDHKQAAPVGFIPTGKTLDMLHGKTTVKFYYYVANFARGKITFQFRRPCRAGIFVVEHQDAAVLEAQERQTLLSSFAAFDGQTCGQAKENMLKIDDHATWKFSLDDCKLKCWGSGIGAGKGAMQCHGFTYDWTKKTCTFHLDVLAGNIIRKAKTACYFKLL